MVWGRGRDGFVWGPEADVLSSSLPHFQGDKFQWPKALCRRFADKPFLLTQFSLAFFSGLGFFHSHCESKTTAGSRAQNWPSFLHLKCDLVSGINFTSSYRNESYLSVTENGGVFSLCLKSLPGKRGQECYEANIINGCKVFWDPWMEGLV